jgi:hypothetical protein
MGPFIVNTFEHNQQDATLHNGIYYYKCSTCFRRFLRPSSGAQNCIHSIGYLSSLFCFLPLSWVSWNYTNIWRYLITFPPMAENLNLVTKDCAERISVCRNSKSNELDDLGSKSGRYKIFYLPPKQPDLLSRPPSRPYDGYRRTLRADLLHGAEPLLRSYLVL